MVRAVKGVVLCTLLIIAVLWASGAIEYLPTIPESFRTSMLAVLFVGVALLALRRRRQLGWCLIGSTLVASLLLFVLAEPRNDRVWEPSVARQPIVERQADNLITIKNVRNFRYRSETDFVAQYYDKTVDLNQLSAVDFFVSYWAGKNLAHIMVSFGFAEKDFLTFSIETRKEATESYSTLAGFYRNYELIYVVADERDVVGLRTKIRSPAEQVYLFRSKIPADRAQKLFLQYIEKIESLERQPEFYNTLTTNCTTQILRHVQSYNSSLVYNWKVFLSGYIPEYLYELGAVDTSQPFETLFESSKVNLRANADLVSDGFSERIRSGKKNDQVTIPAANNL